MLRQPATSITVPTKGRGLREITAEVQNWVAVSGLPDGLRMLLVRHTSAGLLIQKNADPDVRAASKAGLPLSKPPDHPDRRDRRWKR